MSVDMRIQEHRLQKCIVQFIHPSSRCVLFCIAVFPVVFIRHHWLRLDTSLSQLKVELRAIWTYYEYIRTQSHRSISISSIPCVSNCDCKPSPRSTIHH